MRYIYVDESGITAHEPVTIVAGVILHADKHWRTVEAKVKEILDEFVPASRRKDFVFHAKAVWGDPKLRDGWPLEERLQLLHAIMAVPREFGLAVTMGLVRRDPQQFEKLPDKGASLTGKLTPAGLEHCMAFGACLLKADQYVRDYAGPEEVAQVTAEDIPEMKRFLHLALPIHRALKGQLMPVEHFRPTLEEQSAGVLTQNRENYIERIIDTIHFVGKKESPILQIADACAFGFRRYFAGQSNGREFVDTIIGPPPLVDEDWAGPMSSGAFYWHARKKLASSVPLPEQAS